MKSMMKLFAKLGLRLFCMVSVRPKIAYLFCVKSRLKETLT